MSHPVIIQEWEESERGWGVRPDGFTMHKTMADRDAFVKAYHAKHNNLSEAPDEYTRTSGSPYVKDVNKKTYDAIAKSILGMWGKGNRPDASISEEPTPPKESTMTDEAKSPSAAGVEINGGILTRAPKTKNCSCKVPDMAANAIENGDEWQCSCGQKWRAKIKGNDYQDAENAYWRRIAKRTPKVKEPTAPETE